MSKSVDFGKRLVEVRKAKGLTQDEVAERCNINVRTIQRIESGEVAPRAFTIKTISETLEFRFFEASNTSREADKKSRYSKLRFYVTDLFNLKTHAMRKITILATCCLLVVFALFAFTSKAETQAQKLPNYINTPERVEVAFTPDFTFDSLAFIKSDLAKRGVKVIYENLEFDAAGHLLSISCSVDFGKDDSSGSFSMKGSKLNSASNKDKRWGFYRDYVKRKGKPSFSIGCINCGDEDYPTL